MQLHIKRLINFSVGLMVLSSTSTAFAFHCDCQQYLKDYNMHFYAGVDAQMRYMEYSRGFGQNLFKKEYPLGNLYLGLRFCDYWGIEGGYETSATRTSEPRVGANEMTLGATIPASTVHISKSSMSGWHTGLVGFYPACDFLSNPVELLGYVGMTRLNTHHHDVAVLVGDTPQNIFTANRTFSSTKNILRLGLGAQYAYCNSGVRFMLGYENTAKFYDLVPEELGRMRLKLRDSFFISTGVYITVP